MLKSFINKRNLKRYESLVRDINTCFKKIDISKQSIAEQLSALRNDTKMAQRKKTIIAMALAKKAAQETLGMSYYDVQLMGALALTDGAMAEMKTGEGKTLTCSAAVAANYALGYTTHVATANEYLARRDAETLESLYNYMGILSHYNIASMNRDEKRQAYQANVLYSTSQELGFDFLRDNLTHAIEEKLQPLDFQQVKCIIDEADFVLIDEARTPLIISGEAPMQNDQTYHVLRTITNQFRKIDADPNAQSRFNTVEENGDFWLDEKQRNVYFSEQGYNKLEKEAEKAGILNGQSLYHDSNSWLINEALNALRAIYLYLRDKDYIVQNGEIVIIDQNTGRLSTGRTWSNGLHQAIEAKENLKINPETMTLGSISIQNYFRIYSQISGMSGTIMQSSEEFEEIYNCKTIQIPTNRKTVRISHHDQIYTTAQAKYENMILDIKERHARKQPILIGTVSVAESEIMSELLNKAEIPHFVLNAKNNALEAQIIAQAGQPGRVTVATSMAGRGTDIILGGNRESIKEILQQQTAQIDERIAFCHYLAQQAGLSGSIQIQVQSVEFIETFQTQQEINALYDEAHFRTLFEQDMDAMWQYLFNIKHRIEQQLAMLGANWKQWKEEVIQAGGLSVIGSSRNESRRIDDQLKGRAGRQGDPGEATFYMSLEDSWVNIFNKNPIMQQLARSWPKNEPISTASISKVFAKAQKNIEGHYFDIRKNTYQYDSIADEGRKRFLLLRNAALSETNMAQDLLLAKLMEDFSVMASSDFPDWLEEKYPDIHGLPELMQFNISDIYTIREAFVDDPMYGYSPKPQEMALALIEQQMSEYLASQSETVWQELKRQLISHMDKGWSHHLAFIDDAQKNVGFAQLAQKNPLYEYRNICFQSFSSMLEHFKDSLVQDFVTFVETPEAMPYEENTTVLHAIQEGVVEDGVEYEIDQVLSPVTQNTEELLKTVNQQEFSGEEQRMAQFIESLNDVPHEERHLHAQKDIASLLKQNSESREKVMHEVESLDIAIESSTTDDKFDTVSVPDERSLILEHLQSQGNTIIPESVKLV